MIKYLNYDADLIGLDNTVFLGGSDDTSRLTKSRVRENFQGTVRRVSTLIHSLIRESIGFIFFRMYSVIAKLTTSF